MDNPAHPILFYDGDCALCHGSVKWLLARDQRGALRFAPLTGETATRFLPELLRTQTATVVLRHRDGRLAVRSGAILGALMMIGGGWSRLARGVEWIPSPLRDLVYRFISMGRYRVFGKTKQSCPMVPKELRARLLE